MILLDSVIQTRASVLNWTHHLRLFFFYLFLFTGYVVIIAEDIIIAHKTTVWCFKKE